MSKVKFILDKKGVGELLKSERMQSILAQQANRVQSKAGEGYDTDAFIGFDRAHVFVYADTQKAKRDNYEHNTLLKALGGGR